MTMSTREKEQLDVLDGSRGLQARGRAAVRVEDLAALLQIQQLQSAKAAGSTPTKAEFDALVDDVHRLHARLMELSDAMRERRR